MIADLLAAGMTVRGIAAEMRRSPSTVSREIRRTTTRTAVVVLTMPSMPPGRAPLDPRMRKVTVDAVLAGAVARLLARRWSPEHVAHELRVLFVGQRRRWLCAESIYQAIYDPAVALTRPARRRRRHLLGLQRRGRLTASGCADDHEPPQIRHKSSPAMSASTATERVAEAVGRNEAGGQHPRRSQVRQRVASRRSTVATLAGFPRPSRGQC